MEFKLKINFFFLLTIAVIGFFPSFITKTMAQPLNAEVSEETHHIAKRFVSTALNDWKGYFLLAELCQIGPRLSGSENSLRAIKWAEEKMNELGFDSVWLQPVMVPHWVRGNVEEAVILNSKLFEDKVLNVLAIGGSVPTPAEGITAQIVEVKNFEELEKKKEEVNGKIIFLSRSLDQSLVNTFAGYGGAVNQRTRGAIEAAKYGAVGVIVRSVTTKHDNVPHTGSLSYVDSIPKIPAVTIGTSDADFLSAALKQEPDLKIKLRLNCKTLPDAQSYNVIGELKGIENPDEAIVVSGHFDSWDAGCGAHDDGAGCIQALEVLDLFRRLDIRPKRTIRCVFFINEENGVKGGRVYGEYSKTSIEKHIAAIESDRGAFTPRGFSVDADSIIIDKIKSWLPYLKHARIEWVEKGGSGVYISFIKSAKALIGYVPDDQRYFDVHHSANDTFESVHPREMELGSAAMAILTYLISEVGF